MSSTSSRCAFLLPATLLLVAPAVACSDGRLPSLDNRPPAPLRLRTYDLPATHASEVQGVLKSLLYRGNEQPSAGAVALSPTGQLMVAAPAEFHAGVEELMGRLKTAAPALPPRVEINYWMVVGTPADEASPGERVAPEIADTLDALQKTQGPMRLVVAERLKLRSLGGERSRVEGRGFQVVQTASLDDHDILANIEIGQQGGRGRLESRVRVPVGRDLIVGQAGFDARDLGETSYASLMGASPAPPRPATLFYVLRAEVSQKGR